MAHTLHARIMRAEQQLLDRRRRLGVGVTMFGQNVRKQLTSPGALLVAGGLGFVAADVARRGSGPKASAGRFFANASSIVALVRSVLVTIQVARAWAAEGGDKLRARSASGSPG